MANFSLIIIIIYCFYLFFIYFFTSISKARVHRFIAFAIGVGILLFMVVMYIMHHILYPVSFYDLSFYDKVVIWKMCLLFM